MGFQQHRKVRFLIISIAVLLTIFLYTSYSSLTMTIPTNRSHQQVTLMSSSISAQSQSNMLSSSYTNDNDESSGLINNLNIFLTGDKQNVILDKNLYNSGQENSNHSLDDNNNNLNNKVITITNSSIHSRKHNLNNTDILKKSVILSVTHNNSVHIASVKNLNLTSFKDEKTKSGISLNNKKEQLSGDKNESLVQEKSLNQPKDILSAVSSWTNKTPSQTQSSLSSVTSSSIQSQVLIKNKQKQKESDTSKGILTSSIYESGHLDVNPQLCNDEGESLRLLIIITSAPKHQEARLAIRQTWGHYGVRHDVSIAFILGRTTNPSIEEDLSAENYMYGDLIRGHFIDSYNNLTLKTISALEWVDKNCPQVSYVLKTDDDMFINVPQLLNFIDKHRNDKSVIFGRLAKKWKPIRNKNSKYFVSSAQFSSTIYPQFTTGPAYLISSDIVHDLYVNSLEQTYLKLEDVFTTGIVAQLLNIKRVHVNEFLNRRTPFNACIIRKAISVHMIKSNEQFDLWKKLLDTSTKCK